jgi:4-amino-4-deoxy-L-arabinose transferase-like glycosyltransferase
VDLIYDNAGYGAQSINIARGEGNTVRMGGENIQGYYPPGYPMLIAPSHWIMGYDLRNGVVVNFLFGVLTLLGIYLLGRKIAGPAAGALALLAVLKCQPFIATTQKMLSQTPTFLCLIVVSHLILAAWERDRWPGCIGFLAGFLAGMSVFIRNTNVALAAALALFSILVLPRNRRSRIRAALPVCLGVIMAAALVMIYCKINYGSPFRSGDMGWVEMGKRFSADYFLHPVLTPLSDKPFPLLRSIFGLGPIYPWIVALFALIGFPMAWRQRGGKTAYFHACGLLVLLTLVNSTILAFYFMRSELYAMLTVPLVIVCAASTLTIICKHLQDRKIFGKTPIGSAPVIMGFIYLFSHGGFPGVPLLEKEEADTPNITRFQEADRHLEENAVLISGGNPILAEYLFIRDTKRKYLFITRETSKPLKRILVNELGSDTLSPERTRRYVQENLESGLPVYFMIYLLQPGDNLLMRDIYLDLKKHFKMVKTDLLNVYRVEGAT